MMFYMNEGAFALPDADLADRTVHVLRFEAEGGASYSLTVHRQSLEPGESLASLVAANLARAALALPSHEQLYQREIRIGGETGIEIGTQWRGQQSMLYTRQAHIALDGSWLVFAGNAPLELRAECDALVDQALGSFAPRR